MKWAIILIIWTVVAALVGVALGRMFPREPEALGLNKTSITRWAQKRVPAERVLEVERVTGIPRHEIRPDIYPPPADQKAVG